MNNNHVNEADIIHIDKTNNITTTEIQSNDMSIFGKFMENKLLYYMIQGKKFITIEQAKEFASNKRKEYFKRLQNANTSRQVRYQIRHKMKHECVACGEKVIDGKTYCKIHRDKNNERYLKRKLKNKIYYMVDSS